MGESGQAGGRKRAALATLAAASLWPLPAHASGGYDDLAWVALTLLLAVGCGVSLVVLTVASLWLARRGKGQGFARFARPASPLLGALPLLSALRAAFLARPFTPALGAACALLALVMAALVFASLAAARRLAPAAPGRGPRPPGDDRS